MNKAFLKNLLVHVKVVRFFYLLSLSV